MVYCCMRKIIRGIDKESDGEYISVGVMPYGQPLTEGCFDPCLYEKVEPAPVQDPGQKFCMAPSMTGTVECAMPEPGTEETGRPGTAKPGTGRPGTGKPGTRKPNTDEP